MQDYALLVVDAQNEFSAAGQRAVPDHDAALAAIREQVERARSEKRPIAWIRHHNRPHESRAFVPGSWGAELSPGLGPRDGERDFHCEHHGDQRRHADVFVDRKGGKPCDGDRAGWRHPLGRLRHRWPN